MDNDQRHQQNGDTRRMFGRALWLKDNLPITPDEWALLNLLIFGDVPVKQPTSDEFERARAHHTSLRGLVALPMGDPRVERAPDRGVLEASPMLSRTTGPRPSGWLPSPSNLRGPGEHDPRPPAELRPGSRATE